MFFSSVRFIRTNFLRTALLGTLALSQLLSLSTATFAQPMKIRNPNHPLISKEDTKLEKKEFKKQRENEKKRERAAQESWKKLSDKEKEQSPWATWYRKKIVPALLQLSKLRKSLYRDNLFDSYVDRPEGKFKDCQAHDKTTRRINGSCNDLKDPSMGAQWTRFARNIDLKASHTDYDLIQTPNPRTISRELLTRDEFKPVPFLNLLAVGWIQYMTHDWFSHGDNVDPNVRPAMYLPLEPGDPLGSELLIPWTRIDPSRTAKDEKELPSTFENEVTHWWDGSQLYGSDARTALATRSLKDGKLALDSDGLIPQNIFGGVKTGLNRNWWLGLSLMHHVFTLEHNAIADKLKSTYPKMSDQEIYDKARMINAALMAKIHSIEWTPAILPNRTLRTAMGANWKGVLVDGEKTKAWFEFFNQDVLFGIVGGKRDLSGQPFHMTEEFVSVYRMHPLLPDELTLRSVKNKTAEKKVTLHDTRNTGSRDLLKEHGLSDLLYSFGNMHPGQLVLNNFPKSLQNIEIPFVGNTDLGALDIIRDRERGVPRYNEFRRQLKMKPIKDFSDLTSDEKIVEKLRKIYNNDVELIDLMIGCLAEEYRPTGYGFGETAFQVFVIMASRRLVADRFYTEAYNKKTYTKVGLKWIDDNSMKTVLLRHFPELKASLHGVRNAFNPWKK